MAASAATAALIIHAMRGGEAKRVADCTGVYRMAVSPSLLTLYRICVDVVGLFKAAFCIVLA